MAKAAQAIPNKLFFKIGEVCEITDTQPYVLRFWESEFPQLAPRKNRSGQRVYQRRDIETVIRIKKLLYEEEYTIAGARKKLDEEGPAASASGPVPVEDPLPLEMEAPEGEGVAGAMQAAHTAGAESDHPVDALTARVARFEDAVRHAASGDPDREARLERALAALRGGLTEIRSLLKG